MQDKLKEEIESGKYFKDAVHWHISKYVNTYTQLAYIMLASLLSLYTTFQAVDLARSRYTVTPYPFVSYTEDQVNYITNIKALSKVNDSTEKSIARYMITEYITKRERYRYDDYTNQDFLNTQISFLKNNSSRKIFDEFSDYIDTKQNSQSPLLKYRMQTSRNIEVQSIQFSEVNDQPFGATVHFHSIENTLDQIKRSNCTAKLTFNLTDPDKVIDQKLRLRFLVTSYDVSCI